MNDMYVNYGHIRLFCYAGMVLFICAMVNFLLFSLERLDYRKREMALRLVNGSKGGSLYCMLLVEYGTVLLAAASALAFALGYIIMHRWLQQFEQRTTISWWIYVLIFAGMVLVISLTVLHRVSRAASENPSAVINNE